MDAYEPQDVLRRLSKNEERYAPEQLYLEGEIGLLRRAPRVAVAGTRKATPSGLRRAARLSRCLAREGAVVVSGLADGIDAAAHEGAIRAGGRTIAVLGTPLAGTPLAGTGRRSGGGLREIIARDHLLVSQFPPGRPVLRGDFPRRNRTMALLCDVAILVEAGRGNGTPSLGWEALRLGRPLFLLRSLVERDDLKWPRQMLKYDARILSEPEELAQFVRYASRQEITQP